MHHEIQGDTENICLIGGNVWRIKFKGF